MQQSAHDQCSPSCAVPGSAGRKEHEGNAAKRSKQHRMIVEDAPSCSQHLQTRQLHSMQTSREHLSGRTQARTALHRQEGLRLDPLVTPAEL